MKILSPGSAYAPGQTPYDIFKDRMTAISSIADGIKNIIANKYINKQNSMIAENIQNEIDKQKAIDLSNLITGPPPEEIYPANLEDIVGQFVDTLIKAQAGAGVGAKGGLPSLGGVTGVAPPTIPTTTGMPSVMPTIAPTAVSPTAETTETMIPKTELYQLYNAIKDLPTGQISWDNIYEKMTEKKPWFMGTTGPEEFVLNQMLGQVADPRAKLAGDIKLAELVKQAFYPEVEEEKITSEIDFFRKDPQGFADMLKLKQSITGDKKTAWEIEVETLLKFRKEGLINDDELKKGMGVYIAPEKMSEFDKKFAIAQQLNLSDNEWKKFFGVYIGEDGEVSKVKYYDTSAECVANSPKIEGFMVDPTLDKTKGWYANYVKETKVTPDDPNNYLFGKKDVYGNISRMGIIPYDAQMAISYGQTLTDIQKTQIKNNHNIQKSLLDEETLFKVEAILKQIGINLTETTPTPTPTPEPEPAKWWEFWKKEQTPVTEYKIPIETPTETPQVTPQAKKDYSTMSEEELYNLAMAGDKEAYEEAKRRGFIK